METVRKFVCIERGGQLEENQALGAQQVLIVASCEESASPRYWDKAAQK